MQTKMFITLRNSIIHFFYVNILKRIFFAFDPENIHDMMVGRGKFLSRFRLTRLLTRIAFFYKHPSLEQKILGISFANPIGLSAGFDKNAELTQILPDVGFGFEEVGSITGDYCKGNDKVRLWRLPKSKSLCVYYGLKNDGAEILSKRMSKLKYRFPIGISIAKTNNELTVDTQKGIDDYAKAYTLFEKIGDYYTINISCPNTFGGQPFTDKDRLRLLLEKITSLPKSKPIFVKISPDISIQNLDETIDLCIKYKIDGLVISNLTKNRNNPLLKEDVIPENGGFSGKVVENLANAYIEHAYKKAGGKLIIIGCGGVFDAEDAYIKIKLGASLIQMITGMIFEGPQTISEINRGLVKLLKRDGYTNISQAIGTGVNK